MKGCPIGHPFIFLIVREYEITLSGISSHCLNCKRERNRYTTATLIACDKHRLSEAIASILPWRLLNQIMMISFSTIPLLS